MTEKIYITPPVNIQDVSNKIECTNIYFYLGQPFN